MPRLLTDAPSARAARVIVHPGPPRATAVQAVPCLLRHETLELPPGDSLMATLAAALQSAQADGAVIALHGGAFAPIAWALPHTSSTPAHAVYFSPRHDAAGPATLATARVTLGRRDGQPWLHCHARWQDDDGTVHIGHLLPDHCTIAAPITADVTWMDGVRFAVRPDAQTNFDLFVPEPVDDRNPPRGLAAGGPAGWALRLAPNAVIDAALAGFCRDHGIAHALVRGGVGSLVGASFDDGREVDAHITECFIRDGRVDADGATLDIVLVDHLGGQHAGRLLTGANGVLVTFELFLEPVAA